jgi:hypothetical protein
MSTYGVFDVYVCNQEEGRQKGRLGRKREGEKQGSGKLAFF